MFDKRKFKAELALSGITIKELAEKMDIDESTMYRKINNGGAFSRAEINAMIDFLDIKDPMAIFFAK